MDSTPARLPAARTVEAVKVYGRGEVAVRALDGVTVDLPAGAFTAIMGPSGSGKSTLLHVLAGLDTLTSGHAYVGEVDLGSLSDRQLTALRRDAIGFVFQSFNLMPTLTAVENVTLPFALVGRRPDPDWLTTVLATMGLGDRLHHRPSELSGGQQQRVALARALVSRPKVILADEPTGSVDSRTGRQLLDFLRLAVDEFGQTVVMVTHDPIAAGYTDEVVVLADGRVLDRVAEPTAGAVLDRMKTLEL
jgi:putative ABC transport system ATP-binding protein